MSSANSLFGLNLHLLSFRLHPSLYKESDDIRISITTMPEENKQAFIFSARKNKDFDMKFGVNVTIPQEKIPEGFISTSTEKIIVVFRRKSYFQGDPIIASTVISAKDFPKNLSEPEVSMRYNLYEMPKDHVNNDHNKKNNNNKRSSKKNERDIIGQIDVKMSLTDPFRDYSLEDDLFDLNNNSLTVDSGRSNGKTIFSSNFMGFQKL